MPQEQKYPVVAFYGTDDWHLDRRSFDHMDDYEAFKLIRSHGGHWYVITNEREMTDYFYSLADFREAWNDEYYDSSSYWMWTGFLTYGELAEITGFLIPNRLP